MDADQRDEIKQQIRAVLSGDDLTGQHPNEVSQRVRLTLQNLLRERDSVALRISSGDKAEIAGDLTVEITGRRPSL